MNIHRFLAGLGLSAIVITNILPVALQFSQYAARVPYAFAEGDMQLLPEFVPPQSDTAVPLPIVSLPQEQMDPVVVSQPQQPQFDLAPAPQPTPQALFSPPPTENPQPAITPQAQQDLANPASVTDNAQLLHCNVPSTMTVGQRATFHMEIRNTGGLTWTPNLWKLMSTQPHDNNTWGSPRMGLQSTIAPGQTAVFDFPATAPSTAGQHVFAMEMGKEGFYRLTQAACSKHITVQAAPVPSNDRAQCIDLSLPGTMQAGQTYAVTARVKNVGDTDWQRGSVNPHRFALRNENDPGGWILTGPGVVGANRVDLSTSSVPPGIEHTFNFSIVAPNQTGTKAVNFNMVHERVKHLDDACPTRHITIQGGGGNCSYTDINQVKQLFQNGTIQISFHADGSANVRNNGTCDLTGVHANYIMIGSEANQRKHSQSAAKTIRPGTSEQFSASVPQCGGQPSNFQSDWFLGSAPPPEAGAGDWHQRVIDGQRFVSQPGGFCPAPGTYAAACRSVSPVNQTITEGQTPASIAITIENTGTIPLSEDDGIRLMSDNLGPGPDATDFDERKTFPAGFRLFPGQRYTFQLTPPNPLTVGTHTAQYQMGQERDHGTAGRFGQQCQRFTVTVTGSGPCTYSHIETRNLVLNGTINVAFQNNGRATVTNNGQCRFPARLGVYKILGPLTGQNQQKFSESEAQTVDPGTVATFTAADPGCDNQPDLFYGTQSTPEAYDPEWNNRILNGTVFTNRGSCISPPTLQLTKNTADTLVTRGPNATLTYTLTLTNTSTVTANNVSITDHIGQHQAKGLSPRPVQGCSLQGSTLSCSIASLSAGAQRTFTLVFDALAITTCQTDQVQNTATATADGLASPVTATSQTTQIQCPVVQQPIVSGTKTGPATAQRGQEFDYTITVTNSGNAPANNVVVLDTFSSELDFVRSSTPCIVNGQSLSCNLSTITQSNQRVFTLTFKGKDIDICQQTIPVSNVAVIDSNETEPVNTTIAFTSITCPPRGVIDVAKTPDQTTVTRGPVSWLNYTIRVRNTGAASLTGVKIMDNIRPLEDAGLTFVSAQIVGGALCVNASSTVTCHIGTLNAGESRDIKIITDAPTIPNCSDRDINNTATALADGVSPVSVTSANTRLICPQSTIQIEKFASHTAIVRGQGTQLTYTVRVRNAGLGQANNVRVTDDISGVLAKQMQLASAPGCVNSNNVLTCTQQSLAPNASRDFIVTFNVPGIPACTESSVTNTASAIADGMQNAISVTSSATQLQCPVVQPPSLQIEKNANHTSITRGQGTQLVYTIRVRNIGTTQADNIRITDSIQNALSKGLQFSSAAGCTNAAGILTCTHASLAAGHSQDFTLIFDVPSIPNCTASDSITNTASAIADTMQNAISVTSSPTQLQCPVVQLPVLEIQKTANQQTLERGQTITYSVTVRNTGNADAHNAFVVDHSPAELDFVSSDGNCSVVSPALICQLGTVSPNTQRTLNLVFRAKTMSTGCQPITIVNTAKVDSDETNQVVSQSVSTNLTCLAPAQLELRKIPHATTIVAGPFTELAYDIYVKNLSTSVVANGVVASDNLSALLAQGLTVKDRGTCADAGNNMLRCDAGSLQPGEEKNFHIVLNVPAPQSCQTRNVSNTVTAISTENQTPVSATSVDTRIDCPALLRLIKTPSSSFITRSSTAQLTYALRVENIGGTAAQDVVVADHIQPILDQAKLSFESAQGCTLTSGTLTCSGFSLNPGEFKDFTIIFNALPIADCQTQTANNTANAVFTGAATPVSVTSSATQIACQAAANANLGIDKHGPATANRGSSYQYTLTFTNSGPDAAQNVLIRDTIPSGVTFASVSPTAGPFTCTFDQAQNQVRCTAVTLPAGLNFVATPITITVNALEQTACTGPQDIQNTAHISSDTPDNDTTNNQDSVTTTLPCSPASADLAITKTASTLTPTVGNNVTFSIGIANSGPQEASSVVVSDLLPAGLTFVSDTPSQGTYDSTTGAWSVGTLTANTHTATLSIVATVTTAGSITNMATATASTTDPNQANNSASVTINASGQNADLSLTKTSSASSVDPGVTFSFDLVIANNGPAAATSVMVEDAMPAALNVLAANGASCSVNNVTNRVSCGPIASIAANQSVTIRLFVSAKPLTGCSQNLSITNSATVSSATTDPVTSNNTATANTSVNCVVNQNADLAITKTANTSSPQQGSQVAFTVTVTNAGPASAAGVAVTDQLPSGLSFISATTSQGTYNQSSGLWNVGSVSNAQTATMTIVATVNTTGSITNTATVSATTTDPNSGNNSASVTINTTSQNADLSVTKTASPSNPIVNGQVTFTVTVTNSGPGQATNVVVSDQLPGGLHLLSYSATQGSYGGFSWTIGTLSSGQTATLTIVANVNTTGSVTNTASVSAATTDPNTGNNTASATIHPQNQNCTGNNCNPQPCTQCGCPGYPCNQPCTGCGCNGYNCNQPCTGCGCNGQNCNTPYYPPYYPPNYSYQNPGYKPYFPTTGVAGSYYARRNDENSMYLKKLPQNPAQAAAAASAASMIATITAVTTLGTFSAFAVKALKGLAMV